MIEMFGKNKQYWEEKEAIFTSTEVSQQPSTWKETLEILKSMKDEIEAFIEPVITADDFDIIFTGAGTSEFVGNSLVPFLKPQFGKNVQSVSTTNLVVNPELTIDPSRPTLLVSFGRSGNSPESIASVDVVDIVNPNTRHLVITCNHEGNLAKREDSRILAIKLPKETNDQSFAMTSSFTNMYLAAYSVFNLKDLDAITKEMETVIGVGTEIVAKDFDFLNTLVDTFEFDRIVYLGENGFNGFAQESALKILELTAGDVVTMHNTALGFRHGPKSIINSETLTVLYMDVNPYVRQYQVDLIKEMGVQRNGNKIVVIDCLEDDIIADYVDIYHRISYNKNVRAALIGLNYVMYAQTLSMLKSINLNKSPDNPWPSGMVNRVVQGVIIYDYHK